MEKVLVGERTSAVELYRLWLAAHRQERGEIEEKGWSHFFDDYLEMERGLAVGAVSYDSARARWQELKEFLGVEMGYGVLARLWSDLEKENPGLLEVNDVRNFWRDLLGLEDDMDTSIYAVCDYYDYWQDDEAARQVAGLYGKGLNFGGEVKMERLGWLAETMFEINGDQRLGQRLFGSLVNGREADRERFYLVRFMYRTKILTINERQKRLDQIMESVIDDDVLGEVARGYLYLDNITKAVGILPKLVSVTRAGHLVSEMVVWQMLRGGDLGAVRDLYPDYIRKAQSNARQIGDDQRLMRDVAAHEKVLWEMHWLFAADDIFERGGGIRGYLNREVLDLITGGKFDGSIKTAYEAALAFPREAEVGGLAQVLGERLFAMQNKINWAQDDLNLSDLESLLEMAILRKKYGGA